MADASPAPPTVGANDRPDVTTPYAITNSLRITAPLTAAVGMRIDAGVDLGRRISNLPVQQRAHRALRLGDGRGKPASLLAIAFGLAVADERVPLPDQRAGRAVRAPAGVRGSLRCRFFSDGLL
ncbi:MAG: hypothetical protein MI924_21720 [Chloroflexales bacterium]|nr:hypothetical protein [Chloroflexales bacterium]